MPVLSVSKSTIHKFFVWAETALSESLRVIMFLSGFGLAVLMFVQVVMRTLNSPFLGFEELSVLLGLWCYFSGIAYATRSRSHITGGVVDLLIKSERTKTRVRLIVDLTCSITAIFFVINALNYFEFVAGSGRSSVAMEWPRTLWVASMVFGLTLTSLYFILRTAQDVLNLKTSKMNQGAA